MQLALNVLVFAIGFSLAIVFSTRPKQARADIERLLKNVQYVLDTLKLRPKAANLPPVSSEHNKEYGHGAEYLLTTGQVEDRYADDTWQRGVYEQLKAIVLGHGPQQKTFPCVYATKGLQDNQHRYVFLHSDDPSEPRNIRILGESLRAYIPASRSIGRNTSLVIVTPPADTPRSHEEYRRRFWATLRGLRVYDPKPWPSEMPADVNSNKWAFCFDGEPIFPVAMTPLYERRHSRWAPSLCLAFQPKWVFDKLLSTDTKRSGATDKVRKLLRDYDELPPSPSLTAYGAPGTTEAHQLFLLDDNEKEAECPYTDFDA